MRMKPIGYRWQAACATWRSLRRCWRPAPLVAALCRSRIYLEGVTPLVLAFLFLAQMCIDILDLNVQTVV